LHREISFQWNWRSSPPVNRSFRSVQLAIHCSMKKISRLLLTALAATCLFARPVPAGEADSLRRDQPRAITSAADTLPADTADVLGNLARQGSVHSLDLPQPKPESVFSVKNIAYILIVLGLLILFLHLLRKVAASPLSPARGGPEFQILRQYHLGQKRSVALVKFFNRLLLVGISDSGMSTLAEITDPQEVEAMIAGLNDKKAGKEGSFREIYQNLLSRVRK